AVEPAGRIANIVQFTVKDPLRETLRKSLSIAAILWVISALGLSLIHICGWLRLARLRRQSPPLCGAIWDERFARLCDRLRVNQTVHLVQSTSLQVPSVIGWLRPMILMPVCVLGELSPQQ